MANYGYPCFGLPMDCINRRLDGTEDPDQLPWEMGKATQDNQFWRGQDSCLEAAAVGSHLLLSLLAQAIAHQVDRLISA